MKFHPAKWNLVPWCGQMFTEKCFDLTRNWKIWRQSTKQQVISSRSRRKKPWLPWRSRRTSSHSDSLSLRRDANLPCHNRPFLKWKRRHPQKSGIVLRWIFWLVAVTHCKSTQVWSGKLTHDFSKINQLISWSVRNVLRKSLSKLRDKTAYKIAILKAKTTEKSEL